MTPTNPKTVKQRTLDSIAGHAKRQRNLANEGLRQVVQEAQTRRSFGEKLAWSMPWMVLGAAVFHNFGFLDALARPDVTGSASFIFGILFGAVPTGIFLRLQYRQRFLGHKVNYARWEKDMPGQIMVATLTGVTSSVCFVMAFWPAYGGFTMPILLAIFSGFLSFCELL